MRILVMAVVALGCGNKNTPTTGSGSAQAAGHKCTADSDCVKACVAKNDCCDSPCCNAVMHRDEVAEIEAFNKKACANTDFKCPDHGSCGPRPTITPRCKAGACVAETVAGTEKAGNPFQVELTSYSRACTTKDDCVLVNPFPCDTRCVCKKEAIARSEQDKFDMAAAKIDPERCPKDDIVCADCPHGVADCQNGTCIKRNE